MPKQPQSLLRDNDDNKSKVTWYIGEPSPHEKQNRKLRKILDHHQHNTTNETNDDICHLVQNPLSTIYNLNCIIL